MGYMRRQQNWVQFPKTIAQTNLTAAVNNHGNRHVFNERWTAFLDHYGVTPSKNNPGKSNENGSVEKVMTY